MPGYEKIDPCPWGDPNGAPDLEKARQLIKDAGEEGTKVTVWGNNDEPSTKVTQYYADVLNKIGLDAEPRIIDGGDLLRHDRQRARPTPQTGFDDWFQDFPHPANFFFL